jgi:hypothetical protein
VIPAHSGLLDGPPDGAQRCIMAISTRLCWGSRATFQAPPNTCKDGSPLSQQSEYPLIICFVVKFLIHTQNHLRDGLIVGQDGHVWGLRRLGWTVSFVKISDLTFSYFLQVNADYSLSSVFFITCPLSSKIYSINKLV